MQRTIADLGRFGERQRAETVFPLVELGKKRILDTDVIRIRARREEGRVLQPQAADALAVFGKARQAARTRSPVAQGVEVHGAVRDSGAVEGPPPDVESRPVQLVEPSVEGGRVAVGRQLDVDGERDRRAPLVHASEVVRHCLTTRRPIVERHRDAPLPPVVVVLEVDLELACDDGGTHPREAQGDVSVPGALSRPCPDDERVGHRGLAAARHRGFERDDRRIAGRDVGIRGGDACAAADEEQEREREDLRHDEKFRSFRLHSPLCRRDNIVENSPSVNAG